MNDIYFDAPGWSADVACESEPSDESAVFQARDTAWDRPLGQMPAFSVTPIKAQQRGFNIALVTKVERETPDCRSYEFAFPLLASDDLGAKPGQFVAIRTRINGDIHERYYAVSSLVEHGEPLRITVKRKKAGIVSSWLHDELRPGMTVSISRPMGSFRLRRSGGPMLFLAAGIGIAPLFPMLRHAVLTTVHRIRIAIYDRDAKAVAFLGQLRDLAERHADRLQLAEIYTGAKPANLELLKTQFEILPDATSYVCGPPGFLDCARSGGTAAGITQERIFINAREEDLSAARAVIKPRRRMKTKSEWAM